MIILIGKFVLTSFLSKDKITQAYTQAKSLIRGIEVKPVYLVERDAARAASQMADGKNVSMKNVTFKSILIERADDNGIIMLALTDFSYAEMALNLYLTSFAKLEISNFLFVCADELSSDYLTKFNISNFRAFDDKEGSQTSNWGGQAFKRKTHYKTMMILEGLKLGLTVIVIDLDIVLFKNPIPFLNCANCDIQIQSDMLEGNSGFYMARPTKAGIDLHEKAMELAKKNSAMSNQKTVDRTMEKMQKERKIKTKTLSKNTFPCGTPYFETGKRMFAGDNPCKECVLVHNNWILGYEAKAYRFKEMHMWLVDTDEYYSSKTRKYLTFETRKLAGVDITAEGEALRNALAIGRVLNRTVILPFFQCSCKQSYCNREKCAFNLHYSIASFDKYFTGLYREHSFLSHELVPSEVKTSISNTSLIITNMSRTLNLTSGSSFLPSDVNTGPTVDEIRLWFGDVKHSVLNFHSLYGNFSTLRTADQAFSTSLKLGLQKKSYRQLK